MQDFHSASPEEVRRFILADACAELGDEIFKFEAESFSSASVNAVAETKDDVEDIFERVRRHYGVKRLNGSKVKFQLGGLYCQFLLHRETSEENPFAAQETVDAFSPPLSKCLRLRT